MSNGARHGPATRPHALPRRPCCPSCAPTPSASLPGTPPRGCPCRARSPQARPRAALASRLRSRPAAPSVARDARASSGRRGQRGRQHPALKATEWSELTMGAGKLLHSEVARACIKKSVPVLTARRQRASRGRRASLGRRARTPPRRAHARPPAGARASTTPQVRSRPPARALYAALAPACPRALSHAAGCIRSEQPLLTTQGAGCPPGPPIRPLGFESRLKSLTKPCCATTRSSGGRGRCLASSA